MANKTAYTQNKAVLTYLRKRHNSKMTTERICKGVNSEYKMKLTNTQVSKCLNRFCVDNLVTKTTGSEGARPYRWSYVSRNKRS